MCVCVCVCVCARACISLICTSLNRARDLVAKDLNGYSDPYCVVKVNGEVKYRTRVKKKTLNPEWEETLMTHLPKDPDHLSIVSLISHIKISLI